MIIFLFVFLLNNWSWEIFSKNFYLFILIFFASLFCYLSLTKPAKLYSYIFLSSLVFVLFVQYQTTNKTEIFSLSPIEQYQLEIRRDYYPTTGGIDLARTQENKAGYLFYKFQQNFFRNIDLNLFFFGNHPRERVGIREFEKFSFLFLPFFFVGLISAIKKYNLYILTGLIVAIIGLSMIGQKNDLGPFVLMPFFVSVISLGFTALVTKLHLFNKT